MQEFIEKNYSAIQQWLFWGNLSIFISKEKDREDIIKHLTKHCIRCLDYTGVENKKSIKTTLKDILRASFQKMAHPKQLTKFENLFDDFVQNGSIVTLKNRDQYKNDIIILARKFINSRCTKVPDIMIEINKDQKDITNALIGESSHMAFKGAWWTILLNHFKQHFLSNIPIMTLGIGSAHMLLNFFKQIYENILKEYGEIENYYSSLEPPVESNSFDELYKFWQLSSWLSQAWVWGVTLGLFTYVNTKNIIRVFSFQDIIDFFTHIQTQSKVKLQTILEENYSLLLTESDTKPSKIKIISRDHKSNNVEDKIPHFETETSDNSRKPKKLKNKTITTFCADKVLSNEKKYIKTINQYEVTADQYARIISRKTCSVKLVVSKKTLDTIPHDHYNLAIKQFNNLEEYKEIGENQVEFRCMGKLIGDYGFFGRIEKNSREAHQKVYIFDKYQRRLH